MAELKLSNVNKSYGSVKVLHDVELDIDDGEFVVFVGPSGCGKSTLLRVIAGLEEVTEGASRSAAATSTRCSPAERKIAMVFQSYALYPHMSVCKNIAFGAEDSRSRTQGRDRSADRRGRPDAGSSSPTGPQARGSFRAASASAWRSAARSCAKPDIFLFDEPLSNLDAALRVADARRDRQAAPRDRRRR